MNKVILIGRLTRDPELRTTIGGTNTTMFTIAVPRNFSNANGTRDADFISCIAWRKQAENISKYCTKGMQVAVEGRMQSRSYDAKDGTKRYLTEVIADNVTFLGSKNGTVSSAPTNAGPSYEENIEEPIMATTDISEDPFKDFGNEVALSDDDLPF